MGKSRHSYKDAFEDDHDFEVIERERQKREKRDRKYKENDWTREDNDEA